MLLAATQHLPLEFGKFGMRVNSPYMGWLWGPPDNPDMVNDPTTIVALYRTCTCIYPHTGTPGTKHTVANPIIDIAPDGLSAVCRSYIVVFQGIEDFPLQSVVAGRNLDRFEKIDGKWRYSEREIVPEHFGNMSRHMLQPFGPDTIKPANCAAQEEYAPMDTLQSLLDAQQITQLLLKYPVALDSRDFDLLESLFTPDARIEIPVAGTFDPAGYRAASEQGLARLDATQHFVGQPLLNIDGECASARSYLYAQHVVNALAPNGTLLIGAWYNDELRRVDGRWLIASRAGNSVWWSGNPAVLGLEGVPHAFPRGPGHDAPPWAVS